MPMHPFFRPDIFGIEFIYTTVVVFFCFLVYYKTKGIYELTRYKGIGYFRNAFLFFGLAYASRFLVHLVTLTTIAFDFFIPRMLIFPLSMVITGYFSTMAIFYLTYSTIWKKINYNHFILFSNLTAVFVSLTAFISRSPMFVSILQLLLLVFTLIINSQSPRKEGKKHHTRALYLLVSIFWLVNLFALSPGRFISFELKTLLQAISLIVFFIIFYKVAKWVR